MSVRLTVAAEAELATRARAGDRSARDALAVANLRLVLWCARPWRRRADLDDLIAEGHEALVRAADGFDPTRGVRFGSYAVHAIRRAMMRAARRTASVVSAGRVKGASRPVDVSLDVPIGDGDATRVDALADDGADALACLVTAADRASVRAALDRLDARERAILEARAEDETLEAVGARLGVTRERVRQLEHKARGKVARALRNAA